MTDIVSVPTELHPGPRHAGVSAALINAAWNQANTKFDLFEYKMGLVTIPVEPDGWTMPQFLRSASSVAFTNPTSTNFPYRPRRNSRRRM